MFYSAGQTSSRNGSQAEDNNSDTDSEEYWFDNADPKRPQIEAQSTANVQQVRIHCSLNLNRPVFQNLLLLWRLVLILCS